MKCDWIQPADESHYIHCLESAVLAFRNQHGELFAYCRFHAPASWEEFQAVFKVDGQELIELGVSKARQVGQPIPREEIREAVRKHREKKADIEAFKELGIKYD